MRVLVYRCLRAAGRGCFGDGVAQDRPRGARIDRVDLRSPGAVPGLTHGKVNPLELTHRPVVVSQSLVRMVIRSQNPKRLRQTATPPSYRAPSGPGWTDGHTAGADAGGQPNTRVHPQPHSSCDRRGAQLRGGPPASVTSHHPTSRVPRPLDRGQHVRCSAVVVANLPAATASGPRRLASGTRKYGEKDLVERAARPVTLA